MLMEYCSRTSYCVSSLNTALEYAGMGYIVFSFINMEVKGEQFSVCL